MELEAQRSAHLTTRQRLRREESESRRHQQPSHEEPEIALRLGPNGIVETIPLTREILLNPTLDIQVPQNPPHDNKLHPLNVRLRPFLSARGLRVHSDVILDWPNVRNVSPDLSVLENLRERKPGEKAPLSLDIAAEGCRVLAAFEVVSPGPKGRWKDETQNPPFFAQRGVEDCVLVYPPEYRKPTDPPLRVFSNPTPTGYTERSPDPQGFFLLRSIGIRIGVETGSDGPEKLVLLDAKTGKVLPNVEEETERADQAELKVLEAELKTREAELKAREAESKAREAESKTRQEAEARRQAEQLNREMMAELEQLRARTTPPGSGSE